MSKWTVSRGSDDYDGILCDLDRECESSSSGSRSDDSEERQDDHDGEGHMNATTKIFVVKVTLIMIAGAVSASGLLGLLTNDWSPLSTTWGVSAAPFGAIFATYVGTPHDR